MLKDHSLKKPDSKRIPSPRGGGGFTPILYPVE